MSLLTQGLVAVANLDRLRVDDMQSTPSKGISETIVLTYDFLGHMPLGDVLSSPSVSVSIRSGLDNAPEDILLGAASIVGSKVVQTVTQGMAGVTYLLTFSANGTTGAVYKGERLFVVLSDFGSFYPSSLPALTGTLPDGVVGVDYSADLSISGGYLPYTAELPVSGTAPSWMGFSVDGNALNCHGSPNEDVTTVYSFSPRVADAPRNFASSPQTITVFRVSIVGDLPDLFVGQPVSFSYTAIDGTAPYIFSTTSGALPTGLSMDSAGVVTGTASAVGDFSWNTHVVDDLGGPADKPDTASVINPENAWVISQGPLPSVTSKGLFSGNSWQSFGTPPQTGWLFRFGNEFHLSAYDNSAYSVSTDLISWTAMSLPSIAAGGGEEDTGGGYYFVCNSVNPLWRRPTNSSTWSQPSASSMSRANTVAVIGNDLLVASPYNEFISRSTDWGSTYAVGAALTASFSINYVKMDTDGLLLGLVIQENAAVGYQTRIRFSVDAGQTIGPVLYEFPNPAANNSGTAIKWIQGNIWMVGTQTGQLAYTLNGGASWSAGATLGGAVNQIGVSPTGRVLIACSGGFLYVSDNYGASVTQVSDPGGTADIRGAVWAY